MDIDAVPLGSQFGEAISQAVASCDVLIALIGRGWLQATDSEGRRRLNDPDDFVRREIESALAKDVVVVPACVQGAEIPPAQELPASLAPLTGRQGFQLSDTGWHDDVKRLIRRLEAVTEQGPDRSATADHPAASRRPRPATRTLSAIALGSVALLAAIAGVLLLRDGGDDGDESGASLGAAQPSGVSQAAGTVTLGSDLRSTPTEERWYCPGLGAESLPCTFALTRLPEADRPIKAPFDGVVTRWQVQSAGGPIRLIVLRGEVEPGGRSTLRRVQGSAEQDVRGDGRHTFRTRLPIEKGDVVGLQFSTGAYGNAPNSQGTWLESWIPPLAAEQRASNTDSEYDYQLLYNAVIERDADADRFGDASQDECPKDAGRQEDC